MCPALTLGVYGGMVLGFKPAMVLGKTWIFLVPLLWHLFIDRQKLSWSPVKRGGLGVAFAFGIVSMIAMYGAWFLIAQDFVDPQLLRDKTAPLGLDSKGFYILGAIYWITINSLLEEYSFRWFIFRKFETMLGSAAESSDGPQPLTRAGVIAIALTSLVFVVHHAVAMNLFFNWWINLICCTGIFIGSAAWSWLYLRYRSLWPCYLAHALADIPIFTVGYYIIFLAP